MIGELIRAYSNGRLDALSGAEHRPRAPRRTETAAHAAYLQGLTDERARMTKSGRLAQGELFEAAPIPMGCSKPQG